MPDGITCMIECKTQKGKLSVEQNDFLCNIEKNNGIAIVARHPKEVYEKLKEKGYIK